MRKKSVTKLASSSQKDTEQIAYFVSHNLKGGEVFELVGDLGSGKTAFVRGLAKGLGSNDIVASPSFTLSRKYDSNSLTIYHFDFYRLNQPGVVAHELADTLDNPNNVTLVEWADIVRGVLPKKRLTIKFRHVGENERELEFKYPSDLDYLMKGLVAIVNSNH
ncbi:MAG TPA: tRNA (adenosine(37)-N6)-threonylcarbamoyltransferase complex ATPase subunit type 1 TsaE [Patescibacteria group bacterium]|jgi:tRNA threonylcarbamoyladenosine biosynthesis protein TsaE|nr:tRNA (adenosine(37)-N6)-threonylcarbamoyltransferase complex ATPase subunit type 1 TsaE [Patescibacteria group bacterium]